jgi:hypothetical protein
MGLVAEALLLLRLCIPRRLNEWQTRDRLGQEFLAFAPSPSWTSGPGVNVGGRLGGERLMARCAAVYVDRMYTSTVDGTSV